MKLYGLAVVLAVAVLSAFPSVPALAQQKPGNVTLVVEMTPKPGAEKQFEAGLKQLSTWYASNNDPLGKQDQFATAAGRLREAIEKTKSPMNISWLALTEGGEFGTWVLAIGHDSSADFAAPPPDEVLKNAFGKDEANAIANEISALIGGHFTEEVIEFRPDLSYFPKK